MKTSILASLLLAAAMAGTVPACVDATADDPSLTNPDDDGIDDAEADDGKADTAVPVVTDDNLNGMWVTTVDGTKTADTVIESWTAIGIRVHVGATVYQVARSGDTLTAAGVSLAIKPNKSGVKDDGLDGTIAGHTFHMVRDVATKPPITIAFPGDRPFRVLLTDTLMPLAQQDRESYTKLTKANLSAFLTKCELYKHGSWLRTLKGDTWAQQNQSFWNIINAADGIVSTPRQLIGNVKFQNAVKANLKDQTQVGLMLSSFSMYFSTGGGRALRMPLTSTSSAYFITDRPTRAEKIGLVVMDTPTHGPLASTFGRQLLDLGAMQATDTTIYARTMMELLAKSNNQRAAQLSGMGQSALTDWFSVMAIEDYRGMSFGFPDLGWGYNMTNVQFYGLVARTLARPGAVDSTGAPVIGQVIVGGQLRPGEASYADVLNNGNDMQEYSDMATLKRLATSFLRAKHPAVVTEVEAAFAGIVPKSELPDRAWQDIFHFVDAQLYDSRGRTANLKGAQADRAINAVVALFDTLAQDSTGFEAYIVQSGYVKSNVAAPKSTGF
jgi:hypothetical protein